MMEHEALFYHSESNASVSCYLCPHKCLIANGKFGYCRVRKNIDGKLYSLIYGRVSSACADPIEKKPLYHFYPGSYTFSIGTLGCNMRCRHCQNWEIAHSRADDGNRNISYIAPEELITLTLKNNCRGISWTYNEPSIWIEYAIDGAKLAKEKGLYTVFVTNGYIEQEALDAIGPYLDAYRVDIKGLDGYKVTETSDTEIEENTKSKNSGPPERQSRAGGRRTGHHFYKDVASIKNIKPILKAAVRAKKKWNMHVEIITNIVPSYNDDAEELHGIAKWIAQNLGDETPWHLSRFYPYLDLSNVPPTPISTLESARKIGIEEGLKFVYTGNVPGNKWENTYCYNCGKMLIERAGYFIKTFEIENGTCIKCKARIPIIGGFG